MIKDLKSGIVDENTKPMKHNCISEQSKYIMCTLYTDTFLTENNKEMTTDALHSLNHHLVSQQNGSRSYYINCATKEKVN